MGYCKRRSMPLTLFLAGLLGVMFLFAGCDRRPEADTDDFSVNRDVIEREVPSPMSYRDDEESATAEMLAELKTIYAMIDLESFKLHYDAQDHRVQVEFFFDEAVTAEQIYTARLLTYDKLHTGKWDQVAMREIDAWMGAIAAAEDQIQFDLTDSFIYIDDTLILCEKYAEWYLVDSYENPDLILPGRVDEGLTEEVNAFLQEDLETKANTAVVQKSLLDRVWLIQVTGEGALEDTRENLIRFLGDNADLFAQPEDSRRYLALLLYEDGKGLISEDVFEIEKTGLVPHDGDWMALQKL